MMDLKILSINTRGFNSATRKSLFDYVRLAFSIICIQECLISDVSVFNSLAYQQRETKNVAHASHQQAS